MFEKEAEEYKDNTRIKDKNTYFGFPNERISELQDFEGNYIDISDRIIKAFKDGAEFGYNKANEWHNVKSGDLPKDNTQVVVFLENKRMKISIFMENKFTIWNKEYDAYTKLYGVIAWKEIVLPKE